MYEISESIPVSEILESAQESEISEFVVVCENSKSAPVTMNQQIQDITTACFHLILLTQDDWLLETHTANFLELGPQTHYSDQDFISFFHAGLNEQLRDRISILT